MLLEIVKPEKVEKNDTVAHSIPDVTPREKQRSSIRPGVLCAGSFGRLKTKNCHQMTSLLALVLNKVRVIMLYLFVMVKVVLYFI